MIQDTTTLPTDFFGKFKEEFENDFDKNSKSPTPKKIDYLVNTSKVGVFFKPPEHYLDVYNINRQICIYSDDEDIKNYFKKVFDVEQMKGDINDGVTTHHFFAYDLKFFEKEEAFKAYTGDSNYSEYLPSESCTLF